VDQIVYYLPAASLVEPVRELGQAS
jgi:hypothetical protein